MTENLRIPNLLFRGFQIGLCLANWALAIVYFVLTYSEYVRPVVWVQLFGIAPLTLTWLFYIMIEPHRAPKKTNAKTTIVCELIVNALWLLFFLWPTVISYGIDPMFLGFGVAAWVTFIVTTSFILASAWPFYRKGVLHQAKVRVGGTIYLPEEATETVEIEEMPEVEEEEEDGSKESKS